MTNQTTKQLKTKFITLRLTDVDQQTIKAIKHHYEIEGIKLNISKIIREYILHIPIQN